MTQCTETKFFESLEAELSRHSPEGAEFAAVLRGGPVAPTESHCCEECKEKHNAKLAL